ncbi:hypothetical protein SAMN05444141_106165 [Pseudovibrio denitrificans]|uniref:O-antigen ligase n=1 Tax=Pseudovibrio denitrificans TaxID=258256 RepID=A0A1I7CMW9_9HYPH|nr:hypothetical protein [Pseudovibrio denitrificans]SFU00743.1 hypothetical protein SAMN05444141_106165 [Pseudovibrio denitrificans]
MQIRRPKAISFAALVVMFLPIISISLNSPLITGELQSLISSSRHLLIWLAAISVLLNASCLRHTSISKIVGVLLFASVISVGIWLTKYVSRADVRLYGLYASVEPVAFILSAAVLAERLKEDRLIALGIASLSLSLITFFFFHVANDLPLQTNIYGRTRWTFGFLHPGKLAQALFLVIVFIAIYPRQLAARSTRMVFFVMTVGSIIGILLTNTRLFSLALLIFATFRFAERVKKDQAIYLLLSVFFIFAFVGAVIASVTSEELLSFLTSGRFSWWMLALQTNLSETPIRDFLFGVWGEPIGNLEVVYQRSAEARGAFRVDNAFLETFILQGGIVLTLLIYAFFQLSGLRKAYDLFNIGLWTILLIFLLSESGLFSIGNFYAFLCVALILHRIQHFTPTHKLATSPRLQVVTQ